MKHLLQSGPLSTSLTILLLILALGGIAMTFGILQSPAAPTQRATAATCGCNPPPDTHGWTDNMCFHPHNTPGCPQTFPGGYCNPDGQGGYEDADWVRGYYEYRELCPNANLSPARTAPTPTGPTGGTPGVSPEPSEAPTPEPTTPPDPNASCWVKIGDRFRIACNGDIECIRRANDLISKLMNYFQGECPNVPIDPDNPNPTGGLVPTGADGSPFPTAPDGPIPVGLNDLIMANDPPPSNQINSVQRCLNNKNLYQQAVSMAISVHGISNIPWQLLTGIHFTEGGCDPNKSLISGRPIGACEPDRAGTCTPQSTGVCGTLPVQGGSCCGCKSFLDSACDGTRILLQKAGGSITTVEQLAKGFAGYNGWGNVNCGNTPYRSCPPYFKGEDHPYPFNLFDARHTPMYLVYCADRQKCNPPRQYTRPGALSIIKWVSYMDRN